VVKRGGKASAISSETQVAVPYVSVLCWRGMNMLLSALSSTVDGNTITVVDYRDGPLMLHRNFLYSG
jgi:hypothetical protein